MKNTLLLLLLVLPVFCTKTTSWRSIEDLTKSRECALEQFRRGNFNSIDIRDLFVVFTDFLTWVLPQDSRSITEVIAQHNRATDLQYILGFGPPTTDIEVSLLPEDSRRMLTSYRKRPWVHTTAVFLKDPSEVEYDFELRNFNRDEAFKRWIDSIGNDYSAGQVELFQDGSTTGFINQKLLGVFGTFLLVLFLSTYFTPTDNTKSS